MKYILLLEVNLFKEPLVKIIWIIDSLIFFVVIVVSESLFSFDFWLFTYFFQLIFKALIVIS